MDRAISKRYFFRVDAIDLRSPDGGMLAFSRNIIPRNEPTIDLSEAALFSTVPILVPASWNGDLQKSKIYLLNSEIKLSTAVENL